MLLKDFNEKFWSLTPRDYFKPSTCANYLSHLKQHILPYLGDREMDDITVLDLQSHIVTLQDKGLSAKSVRNTVMTLRVLWKRAIAWKIAKGDIFFGLMLPRVHTSPRVVFSLEDISRIVATAPSPYNLFFWLAAETGMRAGELCGLRICDVILNDNQSYVSVRQSIWSGRVQLPKTKGSVRSCAISSALAAALRVHILSHVPASKICGDSNLRFVFQTSRGHSWDASRVVRDVLHPTLGSLGLPRAGLHSFRHSAATLADNASLPLRLRQQRLGHADARITLETYTHASEGSEAERTFVAKLGDAISGKAKERVN